MKRVLRWLLWIALAFLLYAIFNSPEQAASIIVNALQGIGRAIAGVFVFFDAMLNQVGGGEAAPTAPAG